MLLARKSSQIQQHVAGNGIRMSEAKYLKWSDVHTHSEWVNGVAILMSPVNLGHAEMAGFLFSLLRAFCEETDSGKVLQEPFQIRLADQKRRRSPDVMVVKGENTKRLQDIHLEGPADLIVEVISPGTRSVDYRDKFSEYEKAGVGEYWIADPATRELTVYRLTKSKRFSLLEPVDDWISSQVLPGFAFKNVWLRTPAYPKTSACLREILRRRKTK